jgi:DNA polymerase elongation subunit (family B)
VDGYSREERKLMKALFRSLIRCVGWNLKSILKVLTKNWQKYVNAFDQKMVMKRETIADKGIWTAKKRYILNAWDVEGVRYSEPKLKIMGIEAVKSSTPAPCRQKIKDALKVIMTKTNDDLIQFIEEFREEFKKMEPGEIAFPRSVNNLAKFSNSQTLYGSGTPMHVRGSLLYNHYVRKSNLHFKYPVIQEGEKIRFLYLRRPNKINENVIAFIQELPKELGLDKYIDHDLQFQKSFLEPIKTILDTIGWKTEKINTLEFLFV